MATDNLYDQTKLGAAAGKIRIGDVSAAQVAFALATPDGAAVFNVGVNGGLSRADGTAQSVTTLTDGATITWDWSVAPNAQVTLGGNRTLSITNAVTGQTAWLKVIQDGTGSRTLTTAGWLKPALSTAGGSVDEFHVKRVDETPTYFGTMGKGCV